MKLRSSYKETLDTVWWLHNVSPSFLSGVAQRLTTALYAPKEIIGHRVLALHILMYGLAVRNARLLSAGRVFGEDMILDNEMLREPHSALAIVHCTICSLHRDQLHDLLHNDPLARKLVRKAAVRLAVVRGDASARSKLN